MVSCKVTYSNIWLEIATHFPVQSALALLCSQFSTEEQAYRALILSSAAKQLLMTGWGPAR